MIIDRDTKFKNYGQIEQIASDFRMGYIQTLFDYVQTHGLYGISVSELPIAKERLKKAGATHFRQLKLGKKTENDFAILCFKLKVEEVK